MTDSNPDEPSSPPKPQDAKDQERRVLEVADEVPKIPYPKFFSRMALHDFVRIAMIASLLVALIVMGKPCAEGVTGFVDSFESVPDAGAVKRYPGYELMPAEEAMKTWPGGADAASVAAPDKTKEATRPSEAKSPGDSGAEAKQSEPVPGSPTSR